MLGPRKPQQRTSELRKWTYSLCRSFLICSLNLLFLFHVSSFCQDCPKVLKIEPGGGAACQVQSVHDKFLASDLTIFTTQIILTPIFVLIFPRCVNRSCQREFLQCFHLRISTEPSFANHCSLVFRLSQRLCEGRILTYLNCLNSNQLWDSSRHDKVPGFPCLEIWRISPSNGVAELEMQSALCTSAAPGARLSQSCWDMLRCTGCTAWSFLGEVPFGFYVTLRFSVVLSGFVIFYLFCACLFNVLQ